MFGIIKKENIKELDSLDIIGFFCAQVGIALLITAFFTGIWGTGLQYEQLRLASITIGWISFTFSLVFAIVIISKMKK